MLLVSGCLYSMKNRFLIFGCMSIKQGLLHIKATVVTMCIAKHDLPGQRGDLYLGKLALPKYFREPSPEFQNLDR